MEGLLSVQITLEMLNTSFRKERTSQMWRKEYEKTHQIKEIYEHWQVSLNIHLLPSSSLTGAMKLVPSLFLFSLVLGVNSQNWFQRTVDFLDQARLGAGDMWRAYQDMREANYKNSDKYFHARGNYDAAQRGPGGAWVAEVISDGREFLQGGSFGRNVEDSMKDQEANRWGRSGKDPNHFRPAGLDPKY